MVSFHFRSRNRVHLLDRINSRSKVPHVINKRSQKSTKGGRGSTDEVTTEHRLYSQLSPHRCSTQAPIEPLFPSPPNARTPKHGTSSSAPGSGQRHSMLQKHVAANIARLLSIAWDSPTRVSRSKQTNKFLHAVTPFARTSIIVSSVFKGHRGLKSHFESSIFSRRMGTIALHYRNS